jgi:hypothetical protein
MFFYEVTFERALNGIDGTAMMATILTIANTLLLACLLFGAYQAWARGGDTRLLGTALIKYVAVGLGLFAYSRVFRAVNGMFNDVALFIDDSTSAGDAFRSWWQQLSSYWALFGSEITWQLLTTTLAGVVNLLLTVVGYILYPVTYTLFAFFYAMYGVILYVTGPLILALYPAIGTTHIARTYLVNLLIFNGWGVIYAIIGSLLAAINVDQISTLTADQSFLGQFYGLGANTLVGLVSIIYSLAIALIPFIASRIVRGDVGATMLTMIAATYAAVNVAAGAAAGAAGGWNRSTAPAASGGSGSSSAAAGTLRTASPGRYHGFSLPHGVGYAAGRSAGAIARRLRGNQEDVQ